MEYCHECGYDAASCICEPDEWADTTDPVPELQDDTSEVPELQTPTVEAEDLEGDEESAWDQAISGVCGRLAKKLQEDTLEGATWTEEGG